MEYQETDRIYRANGEIERVEPKNGKDYKLEELQTIVDGLIEISAPNENGFVMVMNEEGKFTKPINPRATQWYRTHIYKGDFICGDVLICKTERIK